MDRNNKAKKILREKADGTLWITDGIFRTMTEDWNYDGDVYTDTVMRLYELNGNRYDDIHKYELDLYEEVQQDKTAIGQ